MQYLGNHLNSSLIYTCTGWHQVKERMIQICHNLLEYMTRIDPDNQESRKRRSLEGVLLQVIGLVTMHYVEDSLFFYLIHFTEMTLSSAGQAGCADPGLQGRSSEQGEAGQSPGREAGCHGAGPDTGQVQGDGHCQAMRTLQWIEVKMLGQDHVKWNKINFSVQYKLNYS